MKTMIYTKAALIALFCESSLFGADTAIEITSSTFTTGSTLHATPFDMVATGGQFFITNNDGIGGGNGGGHSDIIGWIFPATSTSSTALIEITAISSSTTSFATPSYVAAAAGDQYFITNNDGIGNFSGSDIVGWVFPITNTSSPAIEITSSTFTIGAAFRAVPGLITAAGGQFFIVNNSGIGHGNADLVGWVFPTTSTSSTALVEITSSTFTAGATLRANPQEVAAAGGEFFITNRRGVGAGDSNVVGWVFPTTSTSSTALVEITSSTFTTGSSLQATPDQVIADGGQFFITNASQIGMGHSNVIGWVFPTTSTSSTALVEITSATFTTGSSLQAAPGNVAGDGGGQFFITNSQGVGSGSGDVVGWIFSTASPSSTAIEVTSSTFTTGSSIQGGPNNVAAAGGQFFITNSAGAGMDLTDVVGWVFPTTSTNSTALVEITSTTFTTGSSVQVFPYYVTAAGGQFFITNEMSINPGSSDVVGWIFPTTSTSSTALVEITASTITTGQIQRNSVTFSDGQFFITNNSNIGNGSNEVVGWVYSSTAPPPSPPPSPTPALHRADTSCLAYSVNTAFEAQLDVIKGMADHLSQQRLERSFVNAPDQLTAAYGKSQSKPIEYCACPPAQTFSLWVDGLGAYFHQKERHQVTPFSAVLGGAILGFDYKGWLNAPVGGGLAVTHSGVDQNSFGHASVNQESAFLYGSWVTSHFYADVALWGCYAQIDNVRTIGRLNAKSETTAWLVTPHLELGGELTGCGWMIEPFAMLDWPISWEQKFREHGAGSENVEQKKQHASLLRTEAGLRFYETIQYGWGRLVFLEKASYVNKKPFHVAPGSFTVDTLTSTQNLGVGEFAILFEPKKTKHPYVSLS